MWFHSKELVFDHDLLTMLVIGMGGGNGQELPSGNFTIFCIKKMFWDKKFLRIEISIFHKIVSIDCKLVETHPSY